MTVKIPGDWFLIGGWVPKEYREKPKTDGIYKFTREYQNPYMAKLVGGKYDVYKGGEGDAAVWVYTFKGEKGDSELIAQECTKAAKYYEGFMQMSGNGEYIIAAQTGRRGNGQGIDSGFVMDSPLMTREYFPPEFLAHELAHSWWGGLIIPTDKQPDQRVMSEGFAEFCSLKYAHDFTSTDYYQKILSDKLTTFWTRHSPNEPALTNENCTWVDYLAYNKTSFVLMALEGYMGTEKFTSGLRAFVQKYRQSDKVKLRPTLADFKAVMDEANGAPIDDFWKVYFQSGSVPIPQADVTRTKFEGKYIEKLRCKNLEDASFPINYRIFGLDGKTKDVTFSGKEKEFDFDGGIAGLINLSADSLIPKPGMMTNTLGAGTIAAALAWQKPVVVCLDSDMSNRASQWASLTGTTVTTEALAHLPGAPLICVGTNAAIRYGQKSLKDLPIKNDGDSLTVQGVKMMGSFSTLMLVPNVENGYLPMIIDTGSGKLPDDLTWAAIFEQKDGPNTYRFRNTVDGQVSPQKPTSLDCGWADKSQKVYDCRYDWNFTGVDGFKMTYTGFNPEKFEFGKIERVLDKSSNTGSAYLDLSSPTTMTLEKSDRFFSQLITEEFIYDGKSKTFAAPSGIIAPKTSASDKYELKWTGQVKFMYQLDGVVSRDWESGSSLLLTGLAAGNHRLRVVFYYDGMLGKIQEFEFAAGQKPPKLELALKTAQCKNGVITVKGVTDPDVTLDPPATITSNGSFEMTVKVDSCPKTLTITATNKAGLQTSQTITITSSHLIKITMQIGSKTATDESGKTYTLTTPPQVIGSLTYVPMRFIGERLGAQILWDDATKKVTYILGSKVVEITIGKPEAIIDGKKIKMPGAAVIVRGKALVPVRFVSEGLGAKVTYEASTKTITIEYLAE